MTLKIEGLNQAEMEDVLKILASLNLKNISLNQDNAPSMPKIRLGDKSLDPTKLMGLWKDNPVTLEEIRGKAWKRNNDF